MGRNLFYLTMLWSLCIVYSIPGLCQVNQGTGKKQFECVDLRKAPNCVTINASRSVDVEGVPLIYKWDMGDGSQKKGKIVDHCYAKPGRYKVKLSTIDSESKIELDNQASINVHIKSVPEVVLDMPLNGKANFLINFSAKGSTLKNCSVDSYTWDLGDGTIKEGESVSHAYAKPGEYKVRLLIKGDREDCKLCGYKTIRVTDGKNPPDILPVKKPVAAPIAELPSSAKGVLLNHTQKTEVFFDLKDDSRLDLTMNNNYSVFAFDKSFYTKSYDFSTIGIRTDSLNRLERSMTGIVRGLPVYELNNLYYASGQSAVAGNVKSTLDRILLELEQNPFLILEICSHTDSEANDVFNMFLSDKRARTLVRYIKSRDKSIYKKIFMAKGFGETKLVNRCGNGVICAEWEHRQNRRSEVNILGSVYNMTLKKLMRMDKEPFSSREKYEYQKLIDQYGSIKKKDLHYVVQVGAFFDAANANFPNLSYLDQVKKESLENDVVIFYYGDFNTLKSADSFREQLSERGIKDAFVFAFYKENRYYLQDLKDILE